MTGLRHNPYVGSFHGKSFQVNIDDPAGVAKQFIMEETKGNPLVGVFRHSPATQSKSLGLKAILYPETNNNKPSIFSQLQVTRDTKKKFPPHNILRSLRQIPTKVYSASSVGTRSSVSVTSPDAPDPALAPTEAQDQAAVDPNAPMCSICLNPYADGDELRTFACSHCFHNECVSKWIFHRCSITAI